MRFRFLSWFLWIPLGMAQPKNKVYFYVPEGGEKCFMDTIPENTPVTVHYNNPDNPGIACSIVFKEPNGHVAYSKHASGEGKIAFFTNQSGEHSFCVVCSASQWFSSTQLRWSLFIDLLESEWDEDAAKREHLDEFDKRLENLKKRIEVLAAESEYEKSQEESFVKNAKFLNTSVIWIAIIQVLTLLASSVCSVYQLTKFFREQKMIWSGP